MNKKAYILVMCMGLVSGESCLAIETNSQSISEISQKINFEGHLERLDRTLKEIEKRFEDLQKLAEQARADAIFLDEQIEKYTSVMNYCKKMSDLREIMEICNDISTENFEITLHEIKETLTSTLKQLEEQLKIAEEKNKNVDNIISMKSDLRDLIDAYDKTISIGKEHRKLKKSLGN